MPKGQRKPKTKAEMEMDVMSKCVKLLKTLDAAARQRTIKWLVGVVEEMEKLPESQEEQSDGDNKPTASAEAFS